LEDDKLLRCLLAVVVGLVSGLAPLTSATIPRPSPEFVVKLPTGRQLLLSSYRGKVVVLMFISTDCSHCQDTCRMIMEKLQKEYGSQDFQALAVAFNPMGMMLVPDFVKKTGVTFPVGADTLEPVYAYLDRSTTLLTRVPAMVFIDRKGIIRLQYFGDDEGFVANPEKRIRTAVEPLLKEPARGVAPVPRTSPAGKKKAP
jgi:thiol-disulfide isomerase/thioredoxin